MAFEIYKVVAEEKISVVAAKFNITVEELKRLNPDVRYFSALFGPEYIACLQDIRIPVQEIKIKNGEEKSEEEFIRSLIFNEGARYRCEQFNTTKVEENIVFYCNTKKQYRTNKVTDSNFIKVTLEEYSYKINPQNLSTAIEATKALEFDKENVILELNEYNRIKGIANFNQIQRRWKNFIPKLSNSDFYKEVENVNSNAANDIIDGGNLEFGNELNLIKTFEKTLFYHVNFNDFDPHKKRERNEILRFNSQIFVDIPLELELQHSIIQEDDNFMECRTVGKLLRDNVDNKVLEEQYNKFYKPIIEYEFSEYNYDYRIRRIIDKKTGLIINASAMLKEEVKNNYQFITQFEIKQIEY